MALPDWIRGMLFQPARTFARAQTEMRFAYLWILLTVFTIEAVLLVFHPEIRSAVPSIPVDLLIFNLFSFLLMIFGIQVALLYWSGLAFGWRLRFQEALKFTGLTWSYFLVEDVVTFVPYLKGQDLLIFWVSIPFLVWRLAAQTAGVRQLSGLPLARSLLIALLATLPWQVPLLYLNWVSLMSPVTGG